MFRAVCALTVDNQRKLHVAGKSCGDRKQRNRFDAADDCLFNCSAQDQFKPLFNLKLRNNTSSDWFINKAAL